VITIKLGGNLGTQFIQEIQFAVGSVGEAIQALKANFSGFIDYLSDAAKLGLNYRIVVDGQILEDWHLQSPLPDGCTLAIVPIARGAGGNALRIITGVTLLGLGLGGVGIGFLGIKASTLAITGAALLLSAFQGRQKAPKDDERNGKRSLIFGGPQTTTQEGGRVPIAYGIILVGWMLISSKISTVYQPA
jgi:predicted phage tail protein